MISIVITYFDNLSTYVTINIMLLLVIMLLLSLVQTELRFKLYLIYRLKFSPPSLSLQPKLLQYLESSKSNKMGIWCCEIASP